MEAKAVCGYKDSQGTYFDNEADAIKSSLKIEIEAFIKDAVRDYNVNVPNCLDSYYSHIGPDGLTSKVYRSELMKKGLDLAIRAIIKDPTPLKKSLDSLALRLASVSETHENVLIEATKASRPWWKF